LRPRKATEANRKNGTHGVGGGSPPLYKVREKIGSYLTVEPLQVKNRKQKNQTTKSSELKKRGSVSWEGDHENNTPVQERGRWKN